MTGRGDAGAASVLALGVAVACVLAMLVVVGAVAARHATAAAQSAADAAALAAAGAARDGRARALPPSPSICALAAMTAERAGAEVVRCAADPEGTVTIEVALAGSVAQARAGTRSSAGRGGERCRRRPGLRGSGPPPTFLLPANG